MTAPRNLKAFARSQGLREEIRVMLGQHPPLSPPLTAKHLQPRLSRRVELRTIQWHIQQIRLQAELESLRADLRSPQCIP